MEVYAKLSQAYIAMMFEEAEGDPKKLAEMTDFFNHFSRDDRLKYLSLVQTEAPALGDEGKYEIWNEPLEVEWAETKAYSEELIPVIRENAPDAIVIVPTPRWDQDVDKAADDPITKFDNIVYSLHYYAATHQDYNRDKALYAINKGLPLFFSETGGMVHTGDGVLDMDSWDKWLAIAKENSISWVAWSVSDKVETCSMLQPGTPADGSQWTEEYIKPWGVLVRHYLQTER